MRIDLSYTEEDKINALLYKSANFRRLVKVFELELNFEKQKKDEKNI